jgi:hypothetical protein
MQKRIGQLNAGFLGKIAVLDCQGLGILLYQVVSQRRREQYLPGGEGNTFLARYKKKAGFIALELFLVERAKQYNLFGLQSAYPGKAFVE